MSLGRVHAAFAGLVDGREKISGTGRPVLRQYAVMAGKAYFINSR